MLIGAIILIFGVVSTLIIFVYAPLITEEGNDEVQDND